MSDKPSDVVSLVDMDGTLCDFDGAMVRDLAAIHGPGEPPLPEDIFNDDAPDRAWLKARRRMIKCQPGWWLDLKPLEVGTRLVDLLLTRSDVHVLTKGPKLPADAWSQKVQWCRNHLPPDVLVTITQDKGLVYGRILVDDWPPYVKRWLEWRPRGLVLMPDQPWNRGFDHPNVRRVTERDVRHGGYEGWLVDIVDRALNRKGGESWL